MAKVKKSKTKVKGKKSKTGVKAKVNNAGTMSAAEYVKKAVLVYGSKTIEDRALPDFRDGLKPVERRILWAAHKLGWHGHKGNKKKSARLVGDVIGKYHPHGDTAVYGTMVKMVSRIPVPLIDGQGNWGSPEDPDKFAAMRYTECSLHTTSDKIFFDPRYVPVIEEIPNFDGSDTEPFILPSLLPNALINGAYGIATGLTTCIPSFGIKGLAQLISKAAKGKKVTVKDCLNTLELTGGFPFGGEAYWDEDDPDTMAGYTDLYKTGTGSIYYCSDWEFDSDSRVLLVKGFAPECNLGNIELKVADDPNVASIESDSDIDPDTGKNYTRFKITLKNTIAKKELDDVAASVASYYDNTIHYKVNVIERRISEDDDGNRESTASLVQADTVGIADFINMWTAWRVELETAALGYYKAAEEEKLRRQNLLLLAVDNKAIIIKSLDDKEPDKFISKKLKISMEEANEILNLQIRRLHKMERAPITEKINAHKANIKETKSHLKNPGNKVAQDIKDLVLNQLTDIVQD